MKPQVMKLSTFCKSCFKDKKIINYYVKFIGVQKGISFDCKLYNCTKCETTRAEKIKNDKLS